MSSPRAVYIAFDVFPRQKGSTSHIASMVRALTREHAPVWLLCLGFVDMPRVQLEGALTIHRYTEHHPNLLVRAGGFARFVHERLLAAGGDVELVVFRDPWGGIPALDSGVGLARLFEVNALPSWELPCTHPAVGRRAPLLAKLQDAERACLLGADRLLTVSAVTRDALVAGGIPASRVDVSVNAADPVFFRDEPGPCPLPELEEGDWFAYVGGLHPWQGVDTLIDALAEAGDGLGGARLLVLHSGRRAWLKALKRRVRKRGVAARVLLQPALSPSALAACLRRVAFTVAPLTETRRNTWQGCCPVKIIESMAAGAPALASDLRVTRALVRAGHDGLLVPRQTPRAWAEAMIRLLGDPGLRERLGRAARATAARRFSLPVVHRELDQVFHRAVSADLNRGYCDDAIVDS
jgi:glycosyltransferase involved in cell wall biosynthesis